MKTNKKEYFGILKDTFDGVTATFADGRPYEIEEALAETAQLFLDRSARGGKLLFIGNGGSASIASHIAVDLWKNAGVRALAFNDSSLLTCVGNDYGYSRVFEKPIGMFADQGDVLIAISSSGCSENILRGVSSAREKGLKVITLSGFKGDNPLRTAGDINFYAPSPSYGHVEITHLAVCHSLVDAITDKKQGNG